MAWDIPWHPKTAKKEGEMKVCVGCAIGVEVAYVTLHHRGCTLVPPSTWAKRVPRVGGERGNPHPPAQDCLTPVIGCREGGQWSSQACLHVNCRPKSCSAMVKQSGLVPIQGLACWAAEGAASRGAAFHHRRPAGQAAAHAQGLPVPSCPRGGKSPGRARTCGPGPAPAQRG